MPSKTINFAPQNRKNEVSKIPTTFCQTGANEENIDDESLMAWQHLKTEKIHWNEFSFHYENSLWNFHGEFFSTLSFLLCEVGIIVRKTLIRKKRAQNYIAFPNHNPINFWEKKKKNYSSYTIYFIISYHSVEIWEFLSDSNFTWNQFRISKTAILTNGFWTVEFRPEILHKIHQIQSL